MQAERFAQVEQLVQAALDLTPSQWPAFLDQSCAGDDTLRAEVESLLRFQADAESFIETPVYALPGNLLSSLEVEDRAFEGKLIGPYQVIREIGRGGMGAVYLAARADDQYQKQVAIKLVKAGLDSKEIRRRFIHERQILAGLDHPNIARLLDGGATEEGLPYLVMDYVEGVSINEYCDGHKLSTIERLKLFRTVCAAVHYAHQHLVVHRDLKPGNILVTEEAVPKLLDFGIAKLLDPTRAELTGHTVTQLGVMTPEYASPEQVKGEAVTTATDVYSLGVVLYELLTGHRPHRIKSRRPEQIARIICEEEPERPSTAIGRVEEAPSTNGEAPLTVTPESVGASRNSEPEKLRRLLNGDLDNIVLMALRKEPQRRYASVEQFSEDIRRYLEGLPVVAHKDTFSYRASKFVQRNKVGVAAAAVVALTLIAGIVATAWQARIASRQSRLASAERDRAVASQEKAERISTYMRNVLAQANPSWYTEGVHKGPNTPIIEVVNDAAKRIDTEFADQPEIRADLHHTIGDTYRALGQLDLAEAHLKQSLEIRRALFGEDNVKVAEAYYYVAAIQLNKGNNVAAEDSFRKALQIQRKRPNEGNNFPYMLLDFAGLMMVKGDWQTAETSARESLELFGRRYGDKHPMVANGYLVSARICFWRGDLSCMRPMLQETYQRSGADTEYLNLGYLSLLQASLDQIDGKYEEAETLLRRADEFVHKKLGDNSQHRAVFLSQLAYVLYIERDYRQAETVNQQARDLAKRTFPADHGFQAFPLALKSLLLTHRGRYVLAESDAREALRIYRRTSYQSAELFRINAALAECFTAQRRYAEAEGILLEGYNDLKTRLGEQSYWTRIDAARLAALYEAWGKPELAARYSH